MALESCALVPKKKISQYGLAEYAEAFTAYGWSNMAEFAFSATFQPGAPYEAPFINEVVVPILGEESHPKKASLRRLLFDSFTAMAADAQRVAT